MHLAGPSTFKSQDLLTGAYKNRIDLPRQLEWSKLAIKMLAVNFGNYILHNSSCDKIRQAMIKNIHVWNKVRLYLRDKVKIAVYQIFLSRLWCIGKIYSIPK